MKVGQFWGRGGIMLFGLALVSVWGCAAKTPVQKTDVSGLRGNVKYTNILLAEYTADPGLQTDAIKNVLSMSRDSTGTYLRDRNVFQFVGPATGSSGGEPAMIVEAHLVSLRLVDTGTRVMFGAMAGRSHMNVRVRLIDAASGATIAEQELLGAPGAMSGAYSVGATDRRLPNSMGQLIGDFVLSHAGRS